MQNSFDVKKCRDMLAYVSQQILPLKDMLNEADRMIGDGDHGSSMARGFEAVQELTEEGEFESLATLFLAVGNAILSAVGGSAGVIFGTLFRSGSKALADQDALTSQNMTGFLQNAVEAIMKRGGAKPGDKTMLDALHPALLRAQEVKNLPLAKYLGEIAAATGEGAESTKSMKAALGRAKTFGDCALGCVDPGALTTSLIFKYMAEFAATQPA